MTDESVSADNTEPASTSSDAPQVPGTSPPGARPSLDLLFLGVAIAAIAALATSVLSASLDEEIDARDGAIEAEVEVLAHVRDKQGCAFTYIPPRQNAWACNVRRGVCTQPVGCDRLGDLRAGATLSLAHLGDGRILPADALVPESTLHTRWRWTAFGWVVVVFGVLLTVWQARRIKRWGADGRSDEEPADGGSDSSIHADAAPEVTDSGGSSSESTIDER